MLLDILERIEQSFKSRMAHELAIKHDDAHWIADEKYFEDKKNYNEITVTRILDKDIKNSKELCIKHYYQNYKSPKYPPVWMIFEAISFGQSVLIFTQFKKIEKDRISEQYPANNRSIQSWMYSLAGVRNVCAHHARLWNKEFVITPSRRDKKYKQFFHDEQPNRLFNTLVVMQALNASFNPTSSWTEKLRKIIQDHEMEVSFMGFPEDWIERLEEVKKAAIS